MFASVDSRPERTRRCRFAPLSHQDRNRKTKVLWWRKCTADIVEPFVVPFNAAQGRIRSNAEACSGSTSLPFVSNLVSLPRGCLRPLRHPLHHVHLRHRYHSLLVPLWRTKLKVMLAPSALSPRVDARSP